jgi:hypothetical protein
MDDLIDLMISNESPAEISDRIKDILMQKSAENIDIVRPTVANSIFGDQETETETENEVDGEYEEEPTEEEEESEE